MQGAPTGRIERFRCEGQATQARPKVVGITDCNMQAGRLVAEGGVFGAAAIPAGN
jgi:hypothetical protein